MPPVIDKNICRKCGMCADACPGDVFFGSKDKAVPTVAYPDECWHCNACIEACPHHGSIRLRIPLPMTMMYTDHVKS